MVRPVACSLHHAHQLDAYRLRYIVLIQVVDNHMINGTKLLNVAGMTRGRRDGILKSEKTRHVVKIGPMHLKGVWYEASESFDRFSTLTFELGSLSTVPWILPTRKRSRSRCILYLCTILGPFCTTRQIRAGRTRSWLQLIAEDWTRPSKQVEEWAIRDRSLHLCTITIQWAALSIPNNLIRSLLIQAQGDRAWIERTPFQLHQPAHQAPALG